MKPKYVFFLMFALLITGLADGVEGALTTLGPVMGTVGGAAAGCAVGAKVASSVGCAVGGAAGGALGSAADIATAPLGMALGMAISWCINITMGAGLILLLLFNGMFHPKFGPFTIVGGILPVFDTLPFWVGLVIAGIVYDMRKEGGAIGLAATVASTALSPQSAGKPAIAAAASLIKKPARAAPARPAANDNSPAAANDNASRPRISSVTMHDIKPPRTANEDLTPYAQAA